MWFMARDKTADSADIESLERSRYRSSTATGTPHIRPIICGANLYLHAVYEAESMQTTNPGASPRGKPLEEAISEFVDEREGHYALNLEHVLGNWAEWCVDRDVQTVESVTALNMRHYATYLKRRSKADDGISGSTARTYYNYVSAFLSWAVTVEIIPENPAEKQRAKDPLPQSMTTSKDQQFWSPAQRSAVVGYVHERAREAIDDPDADPFEPVRNRALVTVLAYTGVRAGEILADYRDDRRVGLRWHAVDLDEGTIRVRGKSQDTEDVGLTGQTIQPLEQLRRVVDPPAEGWPVFPSRHPPSLYERIEDAGYDVPESDPWAFVLDKEIEPPSMSVSGARTLMKHLSKAADVPGIDTDEGEYLTLHGARRGVGEKLYKEVSPQRAQRTLRHADPKTTSEMYSHIDASELGEENTGVFDEE